MLNKRLKPCTGIAAHAGECAAARKKSYRRAEARGSRQIPAWSDIRPADERIEQIFGKSFCKLRLADAHSGNSFSRARDVIEALIAGRLPRNIGITRPADLLPSWARQREVLGISNPSPHNSTASARKSFWSA